MSEAPVCQIALYDPTRSPDRETLTSLITGDTGITVHDRITEQIVELLEIRNPSMQFDAAHAANAIARHLQGQPPESHGLWVHYPWSRRLVHVLPRSEYREVRLARNRNKITRDEQDQLLKLRIGVIGLSVGQASTLVMAMEGIGCEFVLADPDSLSLSNVNRLRGGVHDLHVNKAVLTARQLLELDPYLSVEVVTEGINDDNIDRFLTSPRRLDLLIEECDDMYIKLRARERARELRIPVLMETSDRGMLDVERFDLEPYRPLLHGRLGGVGAETIKGLSPAARLDLVVSIIGIDTMSARAVASGLEVGSTLRTWPQLASAISLGAAVLADTARRIALDEFRASGRFYVDFEQLICDTAGTAYPDAANPGHSPEPLPVTSGKACSSTAAAVMDGDIRHLIACAVAAPSGGNAQPWRFRQEAGRLLMYHDRKRSGTLLDFRHRATYLAFGAAAENAALAAAHLGYGCRVTAFPDRNDRDLVCEIALSREDGIAGDDLYEQITRRCTNRRLGKRSALPDAIAERLRVAARSGGACLHLLTEDSQIAEIGTILGKGDRLRFLCPALHQELVRELRWDPEEALRSGDGIDIRTLELSTADAAALRVTAVRRVMDLVAAVGGGRNLEKFGQRAAAGSSAFGLLSIDGSQPADFFQGGRAMQRVWLTASEMDLGFQPMASLPYLFMRAQAGGQGLSSHEAGELLALRARFRSLLPCISSESDLLLFRLAFVPPPSVRALRRPLEDMLIGTNVVETRAA